VLKKADSYKVVMPDLTEKVCSADGLLVFFEDNNYKNIILTDSDNNPINVESIFKSETPKALV
jgi:hypothetical protein